MLCWALFLFSSADRTVGKMVGQKIGTAIGGSIGFAIAGPLGGFVGGVIGGFIGGVFGEAVGGILCIVCCKHEAPPPPGKSKHIHVISLASRDGDTDHSNTFCCFENRRWNGRCLRLRL